MADINTSTQRKIAKTADIPLHVAKSIVQYRKREAKIKDLCELRNLPGVNEEIFQKICKTFKIVKRTAKSPVISKVTFRKQNAEDSIARVKNKDTTTKQMKSPCGACRCEHSQQLKPHLPVIAISPSRKSSINSLKTFTPCSVRKSLSGGHIVAIYELAKRSQRNETDTCASNSNLRGHKANLSTRVAPATTYQSAKNSCNVTPKRAGALPSGFDPEKVSSIEKWLNTVQTHYHGRRNARRIDEKKHDDVNQRASSSPHREISIREISIRASPVDGHHNRPDSAVPGTSKPARRSLYVDSRDLAKHQRIRSKSRGQDGNLSHTAEAKERHEKSRDKHLTPRNHHRSPRLEKKRHRHIAGDDVHRHRHRRHSRHRSLRHEDNLDINEGYTCIVL